MPPVVVPAAITIMRGSASARSAQIDPSLRAKRSNPGPRLRFWIASSPLTGAPRNDVADSVPSKPASKKQTGKRNADKRCLTTSAPPPSSSPACGEDKGGGAARPPRGGRSPVGVPPRRLRQRPNATAQLQPRASGDEVGPRSPDGSKDRALSQGLTRKRFPSRASPRALPAPCSSPSSELALADRSSCRPGVSCRSRPRTAVTSRRPREPLPLRRPASPDRCPYRARFVTCTRLGDICQANRHAFGDVPRANPREFRYWGYRHHGGIARRCRSVALPIRARSRRV